MIDMMMPGSALTAGDEARIENQWVTIDRIEQRASGVRYLYCGDLVLATASRSWYRVRRLQSMTA